MKRIALCLVLILLSAFSIQAQVKSHTKNIHGQLKIRESGNTIKPSLSPKTMFYHLGDGLYFDAETIEIELSITKEDAVYVYLIFSDAKSYTTILDYGMKDKKRIFLKQEKSGTKEYICLFYSTTALDLKRIVNVMNETEGTLFQKIDLALDDKMVPTKDVRFVMNEIEFSARTDKTVVPVIIEIVH